MTVIESPVEVVAPEPVRRRRHWGLLLLVLAVIAALVWMVGWSPVLSVREVRVLGVDPALAGQVRQVAAVRLGTPLAQVSSGAVTARVETIPTVASVEVRRGWPNVLVLVVTERVAVATVADGGGYSLVDAGGTAYSQTATRPPALPLVTAPAGPARSTALLVLTGLPAALRSQVVAVRAGTISDVVLSLRSGTQVSWGGSDQGVRKAQIVQALLPRRPQLIDVTAPTLPTTKGVLKG